MERDSSFQELLRQLTERRDKLTPSIEKLSPRVVPSVNYGAIEFLSLEKEGRRILFDVFFKNEKAGYLDFLKKMIPILLHLHPSFWEDQHFLRWQLIRLNEEYQRTVEKIWRDRWTRAEITEQQQIEQYFVYFSDMIPRPPKSEIFLTWGSITGWEIKDKDGKIHLPIRTAQLMKKWNVDFPPIPWVFRFTPNGYLQQIPPAKRERGHQVENWAKNLAVYELSQAGMKNAEIGRLLFGMDKSRISVFNTTHPILVEIAKIKKRIKKKAAKSFPS